MKPEKDKKYYLCDSMFSALVKKGILCSVRHTNDSLDTEYADEKNGFGAVYPAYRDAGGVLHEFCANECPDALQTVPVRSENGLSCTFEASDGKLGVVSAYSLKDGVLKAAVTVKNRSEEELVLTDLGFLFGCHTDFGWGKDASPNVIGHNYIGGHGSHTSWYRVDGNGYCLILAPDGDTAFTFYDNSPWIDREAHKKEGEEGPSRGITMLYPFAAVRGERASGKGAKLRIPQKELILPPGMEAAWHFRYFWADSIETIGSALTGNNLAHVLSIPGYTVPVDREVRLCVETACPGVRAELSAKAGEVLSSEYLPPAGEGGVQAAARTLFTLRFEAFGEQTVTLYWDGGKRYTQLYYFVTEPVETLWKKRAAFIASKQEKDPEKWYRGLFCEWNNETGVRLSPDNYDKIGGWRIYEVSCDDPGLSKPAFISSKQVLDPVQEEVSAIDDYIEYFVWGGLQQTTEEPYPYGIYGIPDWKKLRDSEDPGVRGRLHIWRIYDYSHIALTYYNMYRVGMDYPGIKTRLAPLEYLERAYGTACAMFTIPVELDDWNAVKTGLYNERVIPWIVDALRENGKSFEAEKLNTFWMRKVHFFATECKDVFGSEYPFDTTGFESTFYLAEDALKAASYEADESPFNREIPWGKAVGFMEKQHRCNLACRGFLEPAYFWYGSDYRGNNTHYLLSYMSQMGGCSILEHALYYEKDPWEMLRLGYGSLLSSYALMNTGNAESNYGYWFPGREHDGAAGGGFESLYETETWLNQPNHGGSWYYSCEIDLGFCGGIRGACSILAEDPVFGWILYGGVLREESGAFMIRSEDGARRKFHMLSGNKRFHAQLDRGHFGKEISAKVLKDGSGITLFLEREPEGLSRKLKLESLNMGTYRVEGYEADESGVIILPGNVSELHIQFGQ